VARSVPGVLDEACAKWSLTVDGPFEVSHVSLVFPASAGGEAVALKIQFPHRESDHEAAALRAWDGAAPYGSLTKRPSCTPSSSSAAIRERHSLMSGLRRACRCWLTWFDSSRSPQTARS
jgi:hypothetical protein